MPFKESVHIDAALSAFALQYSQSGIWIADRAMPVKKVKKESDKYYEFALKDIISIPNRTQRADGAEAAEVSYTLSSTAYSCEEYALKDIVTDRTRANADQPLEPDQDAARILTELILLDREKRAAELMFDVSATFASYTAALTGGDRWNDASSDPFGNIEDAVDSVLKNSLKQPNLIIMGREVFKEIRHHPDMIDRVKYSSGISNPAKIGAVELAKAFDVDMVLVGRSVYNSANKSQTATPAYVWGKYCGIYYVPTSPGKKEVTAGVTFRTRNFATKKWRDDPRGGDMIEVGIMDDEVVPCAGAGYVFSTVVD